MLDSAFGWVERIADWLGQWVPRWHLLDVSFEAIKVKQHKDPERRVTVCSPGAIHWHWPVTTLWFEHPVARQTVDLKSQTITLRDSKTVVVGGLIVCRVKDIKKLLCDTYDADEAIKDISLSAIHDVCCQHDWPGLLEGQRSGELDKKLKEEAARELNKYGVTVLKVSLTDLAPCRVIKLMQEPAVINIGKDTHE